MTATKPNVLGSALSGLRGPANKAVTAEAPAQQPDASASIMVAFRLGLEDHEVVSEYARAKGWSVQELIERSINAMREAEGLASIKGRPRAKTRARRRSSL